MKNSLIAITLLSAVSIGSASTNDFLTWEHCLERTKAQSPELVSARAAVRELEFGVASASAGFLPQVDASASTSRGQTEVRNSWVDRESVGADIALRQDLFAGGGNLAKRRRALAQLQVGNEQYRNTLSDVELRTRLAYIDVLYAQDLTDLTEKIAERRANNVRLIQLRFDGGRENAGSLARSKAQLAQAEFEVREAWRALTYAQRNLAAAMGQMDPAFGAEGNLGAKMPEDLVDLEGLMKQTPDYEIAFTQIESSKQGMKITRSGRFPTVSFSASAGVDSGNYDIYEGSWNMSLRASMPIYTGNRLKSDVAAAKERVVQSEMDLLDTANSLMAMLQQRWNAYADATENEGVQKESLDAELLRAEISTAKYKQGLLSFEDWDIIESNLINQGKTYLQRRRTSEIEQARWKNTLGWSVWHTMEEGK
jgi:outer membrane protein TolC